jgi:hypothetical protein
MPIASFEFDYAPVCFAFASHNLRAKHGGATCSGIRPLRQRHRVLFRNQAEAATLAHRIALMKRGRIDNIVTADSDCATNDLSETNDDDQEQ